MKNELIQIANRLAAIYLNDESLSEETRAAIIGEIDALNEIVDTIN